MGKDGQVSFEGHAIPGDNDFGAGLKLTKGDNGGYVTMDYGNFRKWYDVYGGFYSNFTGTSSIRRLAADPKMDMGHFFFEIGSNSNILETAPGVSLSFERDTKEGIKSRLTWGTVTQTIQRKIAPSWEDVSETTDTIVLKGNTEVAGINLSGQQRAEFSGGVRSVKMIRRRHSGATRRNRRPNNWFLLLRRTAGSLMTRHTCHSGTSLIILATIGLKPYVTMTRQARPPPAATTVSRTRRPPVIPIAGFSILSPT